MADTGILAVKAQIKNALTDPALRKVTKWLSAEPSPNCYPGLCFGWVEWAGGSVETASKDSQNKVDDFYIVIVTKNSDADAAESDGLALAETIETLLGRDRSFGKLVTDSMVTFREKQKVFDNKVSVNAIRLTLHTWRWIPS